MNCVLSEVEACGELEPECSVGCTTLRRTLRLDELNGQELLPQNIALKTMEPICRVCGDAVSLLGVR